MHVANVNRPPSLMLPRILFSKNSSRAVIFITAVADEDLKMDKGDFLTYQN
tara:strand:+ start:3922 stop:4074 length:153 start_codon:yes stop_codon:yes gene_type:complete